MWCAVSSFMIDDWEPDARDAFVGCALGDWHMYLNGGRIVIRVCHSEHQIGILEATRKTIPLSWSKIDHYTVSDITFNEDSNMVRMFSHVSDAVDEVYSYVYRWNGSKNVKVVSLPIVERFTRGAFAWNMLDDGGLERAIDKGNPYYVNSVVEDPHFDPMERLMVVDRFCELGFVSAHISKGWPMVIWSVSDTLPISDEIELLQERHPELKNVMGKTGKPKVLTRSEKEILRLFNFETLSCKNCGRSFSTILGLGVHVSSCRKTFPVIRSVLAMHNKGISMRRIAADVGLSAGTVHYYIHLNDDNR